MNAKCLSPLFALPLVLAAASVSAQDAPVAAPAPAPASNEVRLSATLNGANQVDAQGAPNKGDSDGTGTFSARLDTKADRLCYTLTWSGIDDPTMAHIHAGAAGKNGPVVVGLTDIDPGEHCQDIDPDRSKRLLSRTGDFYVNVHNGDFPDGAVRGQLVTQ